MEKIKVLLVEDEQTLAMIIKDTLEGQGRPDVLVADVMMPRMDGFEMVRRIRQTDRRTPVLFLTARSAVNDVVEGFELGANDYLKKPFGMQELIVRIKALMGRACTYTQPAENEQTDFLRNRPLSARHAPPAPSARRSEAGTFTSRSRNPAPPLPEPQLRGEHA